MTRFTIALLAAGAAGVAGTAQATVFASAATGVSATINVAGAAKVNLVAGSSGGTAGAAYNQTANVAAVTQTATLVAPANGLPGIGAYDSLNTGAVVTQAYSSLPGSAGATATVSNLSLSVSSDLLTLLGISARTIGSTTTAGIGSNGLYATGSTTIVGLGLTGLLGTLGLDLNALAAPGVNDVLYSLGGLTVTLNEQQQTRTATSLALSTNALHIALKEFSFDGQALSGDVIVGHSQASVAAVPEPASWAMMVCGFGLLGAALCRPRPSLRFA